jgi:hypothetical protein
VAILVGVALVSTVGQVSALHTHAYTDHDHPEHHHGLAAHEHHRSTPHQDESDAGQHLKSCDPGQHTVSFVMGCASLPQAHAIDAEFGSLNIVEPLGPFRSISEVTDTRVHGPPPPTQAAPRAPPLNVLA